MKIRLIASAASVVCALALAPSAVANPPSPCPNGFNPVFDPFNVSGADRNDNDVVCVKTTGSGDIFRDDRG